MRVGNRIALPLIAALTLACSVRLSAHRLDEYLQAARIGVGADGVQLEMSLTPGIAVAERVLGEIDRDVDGVISEAEQRAYAERVLAAMTLRVDETPAVRLSLAGCSFPDPAAIRSGDAMISIRSEARLARLTAGPHRVLFRNGFVDDKNVYLANALVPDDDRVAVTGQERRADQSELTIAFSVRETEGPARRYMWVGLVAAALAAGAGAIQHKGRFSQPDVNRMEFPGEPG